MGRFSCPQPEFSGRLVAIYPEPLRKACRAIATVVRTGSVKRRGGLRSDPDRHARPPSAIGGGRAATVFAYFSIASLRALMQDYDNYKRIYSPDIIDSRLISRDGGHFRAFLQLENTQFLKLIYDSDYDIQYSAPAADRMEIVSRSTRIQQSGRDQGFLWRLNSYWRFEQVEGGVYVQCRAISLSRDLPLGFGWLRGFLERFPRESMVNTMDATRRAAKSSPMHP